MEEHWLGRVKTIAPRRRATSSSCIVATGWPEYKTIDPAWCKRANGTRLTVLDLWRTLPADKLADVADVLYLGSGR